MRTGTARLLAAVLRTSTVEPQRRSRLPLILMSTEIPDEREFPLSLSLFFFVLSCFLDDGETALQSAGPLFRSSFVIGPPSTYHWAEIFYMVTGPQWPTTIQNRA
jgi:hypothetical protein